MKNNEIQEILKIEAEIGRLTSERDKLGRKYIEKNCPFKIGNYIKLTFTDPALTGDIVTYGKIIKIDFDSHSQIEGMVRIMYKPCSKLLKILHRQNSLTTNRSKIKVMK